MSTIRKADDFRFFRGTILGMALGLACWGIMWMLWMAVSAWCERG